MELKEVKLDPQIFEQAYNQPLIHQVVNAYRAAARAGTASKKTRSEVRGGGRKPWRQKGTGNARAGTIRSPIWRGGGMAFPPKPRDFSQKVNTKMYRQAIRSILSELHRQDRLVFIDTFVVESHKTKEFLKQCEPFGLTKGMIVTDNVDRNLYYAANNVPHVTVMDAHALDPISLIKAEKVLITQASLKLIEERLEK